MIRTRGLTRRFGELTAVNELSLTVERGDICGFIGPNGAGKTTTIKMLATLLRPTAGSAEICNYNVLTQANDVKRVIGYMPDAFGVYDDMKVWEYLDFFAAAYKIEKGRRKQIIDEVLALTDLAAKRDDFVEALSRGMKQRLCLAKTLVHDPQVLLLDEPASGLDPRARIELRELLKELRVMGKTILVSSHILTELSDFCNTIAVIEQGNLLVSGDVEEILRRLQANRMVEIRVSSDILRARDVLQAMAKVHKVTTDSDLLIVEIAQDFGDTSELLSALVGAGVKVSGLKEVALDLEDAFMKITQGAVQ